MLREVYSGRLGWAKILNFPTSWKFTALRVGIEAIVAAIGKSDKVRG